MDSPSFPNPSTSTECTSINNGKEESIRKYNKKKTNTSAPLKLSTDPQSVAARRRRHRISNRFKILQSLVPGGSKMDTVSMLEEAIQYVKFLKEQISWLHQQAMVSESVIPIHHHQEFDLPNDYTEDQVQAVNEDYWFQCGENVAFNS
ncbi:hypothetical protein F511_29037 [Dorcoceras hygrometricum]|uniref:BHLH domain-containing protein n=1 Tax=Dorcoceras hygrometricum TaxID=472368 RepID=A0A2Z7CRG7_9LAMI|nr:hypothetical protein F511_29037 [Dorcoceras hygrometricum]